MIMAKVKNSNKNPESFTITVIEKDGSKSISKHITADIVKSWVLSTPEASGKNDEDYKFQIVCTPMVILDENGNEKTLWQNLDGSWS